MAAALLRRPRLCAQPFITAKVRIGIEPRVQIIINEIAQVNVTQIRDTDSLNFSAARPLNKLIAWHVRTTRGVLTLGALAFFLRLTTPHSSARQHKAKLTRSFKMAQCIHSLAP